MRSLPRMAAKNCKILKHNTLFLYGGKTFLMLRYGLYRIAEKTLSCRGKGYIILRKSPFRVMEKSFPGDEKDCSAATERHFRNQIRGKSSDALPAYAVRAMTSGSVAKSSITLPAPLCSSSPRVPLP